MATAVDRISVSVPDLTAAIAQYERLLGVTAAVDCGPDGAAAWFGLSNTVIELRQGVSGRSVIQGLVLTDASVGQSEVCHANVLGLDLRRSDGRATAEMRVQRPECVSNGLGVDHLVLRTEDASACIAVFRDQLGIRLALDKTEPQWGGRMLFFRCGKVTIEVIVALPGDESVPAVASSESVFWGLAYQCPDVVAAVARLREQGVKLSSVRAGRKPGTQVATVRSHCLDIPTLLIQGAAA